MMWERIPEEHRRTFVISSFVYIPIGVIIGFALAAIAVKFIFTEIELGGLIFMVVGCVLFNAILIVINYWNLTKKNTEGDSTGDPTERE